MSSIPTEFARTTVSVYGEVGRVWLAQLPALLAEYAERWQIVVHPPFALTYNYVAPATRADGTPVVLKAGVPSRAQRNEHAALQHYGGRGCALLLDADRARGVLLIERLQPGALLADLEDDQAATAIAADVMRALWRPAPAEHEFPTVADWFQGLERLRVTFGGGSGPFPEYLVGMAETLAADLLSTAAAPVLLHGDLHHSNILSATRAPWLALDPQGVIGEPACEVGSFLRNPDPQLFQRPDLGRVLVRRVDQLAEALRIDRKRVRGWGVAFAVLSAWWTFEDLGTRGDRALHCAELLSQAV